MKSSLVPFALSLTVLLTACDVHEFPIEPEKEPLRVVLDLDYSTELPLYKEVEYPDGTAQNMSTRAESDYQIRYTVQMFSVTDRSRATLWSRSDVDYTTTVYRPVSDDLSAKIEVNVPDGPYVTMVWTDYVPLNPDKLPFYDVENFSDIHYTDLRHYVGSTDFRDAFRGEVEFDIPDEAYIDGSVQTVPISMERPLGKYRIIATDVEQFISRVVARDGVQAQSPNDSRAFDFSKYKVRLVYSAYLPTAFNMFLNKPVDSSLGVSYLSDIELISDTEACLAFDYVMVNGSEAKVDAIVQLTNSDGKVIAQSSQFRIPLVRSKLTEVRGKFLTASSASSVGIITEFDGEYNIEIK